MFSSKVVKVGNVALGGSNPVAVQTMYDSQIAECDVEQVLHRMRLLKAMG